MDGFITHNGPEELGSAFAGTAETFLIDPRAAAYGPDNEGRLSTENGGLGPLKPVVRDRRDRMGCDPLDKFLEEGLTLS